MSVGSGERVRKDAGFTLIELLVVVLIIGVLAAIAIPTFMGQESKANDAAAKSLVRNAALTVESAYMSTGSYAALTTAQLAAIDPAITFTTGAATAANDQVRVAVTATGYTLTSKSKSGTTFRYVKNLTRRQVVSRTCGTGCTW
jgi:type IV pilus assembly protein PilA